MSGRNQLALSKSLLLLAAYIKHWLLKPSRSRGKQLTMSFDKTLILGGQLTFHWPPMKSTGKWNVKHPRMINMRPIQVHKYAQRWYGGWAADFRYSSPAVFTVFSPLNAFNVSAGILYGKSNKEYHHWWYSYPSGSWRKYSAWKQCK